MRAAIHRLLEPSVVLTIGFDRSKVEIGENCIANGSLCLASAVVLPLGLRKCSDSWARPEDDLV